MEAWREVVSALDAVPGETETLLQAAERAYGVAADGPERSLSLSALLDVGYRLADFGHPTVAASLLGHARGPRGLWGERSAREAPKRDDWYLRFSEAQIIGMTGDWDGALTRLAELEQLLPALDTGDADANHVRAGVLNERALIRLELGRIDEAFEAARQAADAAERAENVGGLMTAASVGVEARMAVEDFAGALEKIAEARRVVEGLGAMLPASFDYLRGRSLVRVESAGHETHSEGLEVLARCADDATLPIRLRVGAARVLAELAIDRGALEEAEDWLERAVSLFGSSQPSAERVASLAAARTRLILKRGGDLTRPEVVKSVEDLGRAFDGLLEDWRAVDRSVGELGFLQLVSRREALAQLVDGHLRCRPGEEGQRRALQQVIAAHGCGTLSIAFGRATTRLEDIRGSVLTGEDHGIVVFVPGADLLHVFAIDRDAIVHELVPDYREIRSSIRSYLGVLRGVTDVAAARTSPRKVEYLQAESYELGSRLLSGEIARKLGTWSRVTFVGDQLLEGLPMETLSLDGEALIGETWATDAVPSLTLASVLGERPLSASKEFRVLLGGFGAGSVTGPAAGASSSMTPFEIGPSESGALLAAYESGRSESLLGRSFTADALTRSAARRPAVAHLFAHGVYDPTRTRGACLVLAAGSKDASDEMGALFSCEDAERLGLDGIVILSACSAARGPKRLGDDALGHLGGAFIRGGCRAVVLSQAKVALDWSITAGEIVHGGLERGLSPAEAMRDARARTWQAEGATPVTRWRAAHMRVVGAGQRPVVSKEAPGAK